MRNGYPKTTAGIRDLMIPKQTYTIRPIPPDLNFSGGRIRKTIHVTLMTILPMKTENYTISIPRGTSIAELLIRILRIIYMKKAIAAAIQLRS